MLYQVVHVVNPKDLEIVIVLGYLLTDLYSPQIVFNKMTTTVVEYSVRTIMACFHRMSSSMIPWVLIVVTQ